MFWFFLLLSDLLISHTAFSEENSKLIFVQTLFRHGDRAPYLMYPTDTNKEDCWPEGVGKLTLLGKKQQYALGQFLRNRYEDFITTNPTEVLVNSSATERCLNSAATTLASFYAPKGKWKIQEDLRWQPIPIHYVPIIQDKFLSFRGECPRAVTEMTRSLHTEEMREIFRRNQAKLDIISNYARFNVSEGWNAMFLHDTLFVEKTKNLTIPSWVDLYWNELEETSIAVFKSVISSPTVLRLRIGPLLQDISQNINKKINGQLPNLKVQIYSAHDINIAGVLLALNFTNMPRPPYSATLLFELHEMTDSSKAVRLLYSNSTDPHSNMEEPHILVLDECSEFCPVEKFTKAFEHLIPVNYDQECQNGI